MVLAITLSPKIAIRSAMKFMLSNIMDPTCPQVTCPCSSTGCTCLHWHHIPPVFFLHVSFLLPLLYWLLLIKPNSMGDPQDSVLSPLISIYFFLCVWSHQFLYFKMITWKSLLLAQTSPFALQTLHDKLPNFYTWIAHTVQICP